MVHFLQGGWTPALCIGSVLISIQSLLGSQPYQHFPSNGLKKGIDAIEESDEYNVKIQYETIRVAILDMIEGSTDTTDMPVELKQIMMAYFTKNIDHYEQMIRFYADVYQLNSEYDHKELLNRFIRLKERLVREEDGTYSLTSLPCAWKKHINFELLFPIVPLV